LPSGTPDESRAQGFLQALDGFRTCPARLLAERLAWLIGEFPELRRAPAPLFPVGLETVQGNVTGALAGALRREALAQTSSLAGGGEPAPIEQHAVHPLPFLADAYALARTLHSHFLVPRGGVTVLAPGRFDRRAAARGEIPLRMRLPGREHAAPRLLLCLDASGSMGAPAPGSGALAKWTVAQIAAQAVALSVQSAGGDLVGLVFGDSAWMTPSGDAAPLTLAHGTIKGRTGSGTSFAFLSELWRRYPDHQVLVITDGSGDSPDAVLPADRQRTGAVIIPQGEVDRAQSWSARQVVLNDLRHLAAVLAMLVPRAQLG
jgi:hypothetical protein